MKKTVSRLLTLATVLTMAAPALAGERQGAFSISPYVGGYTYDGAQHLETAPVYGLRLGYDLTKNWGVEAVGNYVATEGTKNDRSVNAISYRLDILYNFLPDGPLVPYVALGGGGITYGHGKEGFKIKERTTDATVNAGFGLKYFLTDSVALRGDFRQLFLIEDPKGPKYNWEYSAGISFLFGGTTAVAPVVAPVVAPAPAAPTSSLTATPATILKGQSATLNWSSQDATNCDIQPGIGPVRPQGSMTITPAANTSYSLTCNGPGGSTTSNADVRIEEPAPPVIPAPTAGLTAAPTSVKQGNPAKLTWTSQNATKCDIQPVVGPVEPQGSRDVTPSADTTYTLTCSGEGGTITSAANVGVVVPTMEQRCVTLHIEFAFGKAVIPAKYHDQLGKVASFMKEFPQVKGVIEGHTDNKGTHKYNQKLSERRAQSVREYLVKKFGIDGSRLTTKGYSFDKPVASNKTAAGRQQNRRIVANYDCVEQEKK